MAVSSHTLEDVYRKALTDAAFWKKLRKDAASAVQQAGFTLSADDLYALQQAVSSDKLTIDQNQFMEGFHKNPRMQVWAGRWMGRWPLGRWPERP